MPTTAAVNVLTTRPTVHVSPDARAAIHARIAEVVADRERRLGLKPGTLPVRVAPVRVHVTNEAGRGLRLEGFLACTRVTEGERTALHEYGREVGDSRADYVTQLFDLWRASGAWSGTSERPQRGDVIAHVGGDSRFVGATENRVVTAAAYEDFDAVCEDFDQSRVVGRDSSAYTERGPRGRTAILEQNSLALANGSEAHWTNRLDVPATQTMRARARAFRAAILQVIAMVAKPDVLPWHDAELIDSLVAATRRQLGRATPARLAASVGMSVTAMSCFPKGQWLYHPDNECGSMLVVSRADDAGSATWIEAVAHGAGRALLAMVAARPTDRVERWVWERTANRIARALLVPEAAVARGLLVYTWFPLEREGGSITDESGLRCDAAVNVEIDAAMPSLRGIATREMVRQRLYDLTDGFEAEANAAARRAALHVIRAA